MKFLASTIKYGLPALVTATGLWLAITASAYAWIPFALTALYYFVVQVTTKKTIRQVALSALGDASPGDNSKEEQPPLTLLVEEFNASRHQLDQVSIALQHIASGNALEGLALEGEAGAALLSLENKLAQLKEEEARRIRTAEGVAAISEIRKNSKDLAEYAYLTLSSLIKHVDANQGGFYLFQEEENQLELLASYAYGKQKFNDQKVVIAVGQGLLGQSVLEKKSIMIKQVPQDYVRITSGLGEATPGFLLIVPLIFREKVFGAIELAAFQVLDTHHLDLIEKVKESIAAELSEMRFKDSITQLLEQSQQQAEDMRSGEEELRQNMEELQSTQEEMHRKEMELQKKLDEVEIERKKNLAILNGCMDGVISFNDKGRIEFINTAAQEIFGYTYSGLVGAEITKLISLHIVKNSQGKRRVYDRTGNEVTIRTEVTATSTKGEELSLLLTAAQADVDEMTFFTLFIQKISIDLF